MKAVAAVATAWLKPLARKTLPDAARLGLRNQLERVLEAKQDLYDRIIVKKREFTNKEGFVNFNFSLIANRKREGVSAMLRVKNEESKIYYSLKSIYEIFDEIVLVDNGSTDRTLEIAREFKIEEDQTDKIKIYFYPFKLARCGDEHYGTPEDSVCSITYYTNWALSKCSCRYICKWDGDMVLRKEVRKTFREFLGQIQTGRKCGCVIYGQTVYRDGGRQYYLAKGEINGEIEIFPNRINTWFRKVDDFELLSSNPPLREAQVAGVTFYELKFTDENEFSHWSISEYPTERKKREFENFQLVKKNNILDSRFEKLPATFLDDQIA
jgi:glycosyltransferase involved in cell wall biosynthesis